jgi:hypothetical protein
MSHSYGSVDVERFIHGTDLQHRIGIGSPYSILGDVPGERDKTGDENGSGAIKQKMACDPWVEHEGGL